jgi:transposase
MTHDTSSRNLLPPDALTIGLDLSDRTAQVCTLDASGQVLEESKISLTELALLRRFGTLPPARVALEVGTHSPWVSRLLESFGHHMLVANARQLRLIAHSDSKADRADAELLARVARRLAVLLHRLWVSGATYEPLRLGERAQEVAA